MCAWCGLARGGAAGDGAAVGEAAGGGAADGRAADGRAAGQLCLDALARSAEAVTLNLSGKGPPWGDGETASLVAALLEQPEAVARLSGLSYRVKRELLRNRGSKEGESTPLWDAVHQVARDAVKALEDAVEAGAGWAAPLTVTVNVGSEAGKHRSVVVCEAAAVAVRNLLRRNEGGIEVPCSVGTRHRDVDRKRGKEKKGNDD